MKRLLVTSILFILVSASCVPSNQHFMLDEAYLQRRSFQSRVFDTSDRDLVLRNIISTMQDLGFLVESTDEKLGTISGSSAIHKSKMTVVVSPNGQNRIAVRATAHSGKKEISEPLPYQNFFNSLAQSLFLDTHLNPGQVEKKPVSPEVVVTVPASQEKAEPAVSDQIPVDTVQKSDLRIKTRPPYPPYPAAARKSGVQEAVRVEITVGIDGDPTFARATSGPEMLYGDAIEWAMKFRFEPATRNGRPIQAIYTTYLIFSP